MIEELLSKLQDHDLIKENYYRYIHELNKTSFFMNSAKDLIEFILINKDIEHNK